MRRIKNKVPVGFPKSRQIKMMANQPNIMVADKLQRKALFVDEANSNITTGEHKTKKTPKAERGSRSV